MRRITGVLVCGSVGEQQAQEIELNVQYELMDLETSGAHRRQTRLV